jgi:hypothetical protein
MEEPAMLRRFVMITAAVFTAAPAFAIDMPPRKPGQWEVAMEFVGAKMPAQVVKQCVDVESDKLMNTQFGGSAQENCSKKDVQKGEGTMTVDSVCKVGDATVTTHSVITGSFDSAYTVNVTSKREGGKAVPGMPPGGTMQMKIGAKWLGACAADQKPGDMIMANGMKVNVFDMPGMPKRQ